MVIGIVIGLIIWLAVPMFFEVKRGKKGKKSDGIQMICKIIGITIIVVSIIKYFLS